MAAREYTYTVYAQAPNVIHIFLIMITKNIYPLPKNTQGTHRQYLSFFKNCYIKWNITKQIERV